MSGLFNFFNRRSQVPIEQRNYGMVYLILSGLLFLGTMWSVLDEVTTRRPWKEFQEDYYKLSGKKWGERLATAVEAFDSSAFRDLDAQLREAEGKVASPEVKGMTATIAQIDEDLLDVNREFTFAKSRGDEAYYFWKKSIHEGKEDKGYETDLRSYEKKMAVANARVEELTARRDSLQRIVDTYRNAVKAVRNKEKDLYVSIEAARTKIDRLHASSVSIRQVMSNSFDKSNFGTPKARIDRCQTCHLGWKDETMDSSAQPYTIHPLPELLKIHNPEVFGCTPCHRGQGAALTAGMAHGDEDHYWEWPLLKGKEVYASCNSCHMNETYMKYGDRFNRAKLLLAQSGCFGCHEIKGYLEMPKIGPQLNQLAVKEKQDWLFRWVRNPKEYNPHTRMPNFKFTDDQAEAVGAYLWSIAKTSDFKPRAGIAGSGNAASGKKIVDQVGCKGCHVVGDDLRMRQDRGTSYDIAPELTRVGSKANPDWIFEWIKNPRGVNPDARMPNLRLTDQEARDVTAYLLTLKDDRTFEQKTLHFDDPQLIKKGEKTIKEFGCAGCHTIKGMEKETRVSVSLSNIGRKRVDEIDFGDTKREEISHTWDDWILNKLRNSRVYATDRIVSKMPVFSFADSEIVAIRTLLRGYTKEVPEEMYQQAFDTRQQEIEAGRRLTHYQYNCISCHKFEETGGYIKATLEDEAFAPPYLYPEGDKVQEPWLHNFLKGPTPIRPWLSIRMPTFSLKDEEITVVSKYFLALHKRELELRDYHPASFDPKYLAVGKKLFEDLQCLSCHYTGKIPEGRTAGDLAPNLAMAKDRLKPDWIVDWIINPEAIQPGTKMPMFYQDIKEPSPYSPELGGDAKEQIKALRDHVLTISGTK
jgi:mono/diheme cytochrome c family protein